MARELPIKNNGRFVLQSVDRELWFSEMIYLRASTAVFREHDIRLAGPVMDNV